jgi:hypothetical protein
MKVYNLLTALMLSMSLFSSCAREEGGATDDSAVIRLSLGTGATKTNAAIPADNGGTVGQNEGKINNVCVGIFDSSDNMITLYQYTYSGTVNIITKTTAKNILIAANVPKGTFSGVTTRTGFLNKVQNLSYTTSTDGLSNSNKTVASSQTLTALPMFTSTTLSSSLTASSTSSQSLTLSRVVSRVVLKSLSTNFGSTVGFANATFVPREIFMYNVNDQYQWNGTSSSSGTNLSGEITSGSPGALAASSSSNTGYLSSGLLSSMTGVAGTNTYLSTSNNPYFFYVFPNGATTPTKLIIKGIFYPKGATESTGEVMYYPIIINHSQTGTTIKDTDGSTYANGAAFSKDSQLAANTSYDLSITIQGRGVSTVSQDITPSSATVTMTVANWTSITYPTNTFTPAKAYPGNFYYNDGSWGTSATPTDGRTAIGVVFSNQTSTADKAHGWTHGYAMALTNATTAVAWSSSANASTQEFTPLVNTLTDFETELSGYDHCQTILNKEKANNSLSTFSTDYPAIYYALNYGTSSVGGIQYAAPTATNNSGWYLPSSGQWYQIVTNLGGATGTPTQTTDSGSGIIYWYYSGMASTVSNGINSYLNKVVSGGNLIDWSSTAGRWYWCSSERNGTYACTLSFSTGGYIDLILGSKTNGASINRVRSALAF